MIGILCDNGKVSMYAHLLFPFIKSFKKKANAVVLFTIKGIDIKNKKVTGIIVDSSGIKKSIVTLPPVIFNFIYMERKNQVKTFESILSMNNIAIINEINRFNLLMIMQMLSSSVKFSEFVLPYRLYNANALKENGNLRHNVFIPLKSSNKLQALYDEIPSGVEKNALIKKRWIQIKTPSIRMYKSMPFVIRNYVQKGSDGAWLSLGKMTLQRDIFKNTDFMKLIREISVDMAVFIEKFIPGMGICYMDFIIDEYNNPYFVNFGGFDRNIILQQKDMIIIKYFLKNLFGYAFYLIG